MGALGFTTALATRDRWWGNGVMGAPAVAAGFGMFPFGIRHYLCSCVQALGHSVGGLGAGKGILREMVDLGIEKIGPIRPSFSRD